MQKTSSSGAEGDDGPERPRHTLRDLLAQKFGSLHDVIIARIERLDTVPKLHAAFERALRLEDLTRFRIRE